MIVFRADLSPQTGLRPVRRSAWLASLLKKTNPLRFCSRDEKKTAKFLTELNIPFILSKEPGALDLAGVKAIIFDLPHFSSQDNALLEKAKNSGVRSIQIVSAGGARQTTGILVQPLVEREEQDATTQVVIFGPTYALLHHKFRHFNQVKRKYRKNIKNIFINLGDLLPYRDLREIVDTLHRLGYKMKIAPGLNLKKADKRNLMKIYPGIHFCGRSESPARAYFEADLALVPAGEEILEAAAVGTPALYMPLEKMHEALADSWIGKGTGVKIPALADFSVPTVRAAIAPLDQETREKMGASGKKLIDGLGVQRFFKVLKENGIIS